MSCEGSSPGIDGVIFENCSASSGGGFYAIDGGDPWLTDCSFIGNSGWNYHGGAAYMRSGASPHFVDCHFENNSCNRKGGAIGIHAAVDLQVTSCTFIGNTALTSDPYFGGGAIHLLECSNPDIRGCTFIDNSAPRGGAIVSQGCLNDAIKSCTFVLNSAAWGTSVFLRNSSPWIDRTIIAFDQSGTDALYCAEASYPVITQCCVFGNASGNSLCGSYEGTVYEDPLFCDLWSNDLTLHENSPCMPLNNPHGVLIGAHEQGCGYSAVEERSWGSIKAMYR
ncbi:right-handed parallel beta-helix repeat-containing protein [bacterium]|nr:right-handed parallel beta-helix repeat-containing protein [bacterium]